MNLINHIHIKPYIRSRQEKILNIGLKMATKPWTKAGLIWRLSTAKQLDNGYCSVGFREKLMEFKEDLEKCPHGGLEWEDAKEISALLYGRVETKFPPEQGVFEDLL